jgi:hypothetical protein
VTGSGHVQVSLRHTGGGLLGVVVLTLDDAERLASAVRSACHEAGRAT